MKIAIFLFLISANAFAWTNVCAPANVRDLRSATTAVTDSAPDEISVTAATNDPCRPSVIARIFAGSYAGASGTLSSVKSQPSHNANYEGCKQGAACNANLLFSSDSGTTAVTYDRAQDSLVIHIAGALRKCEGCEGEFYERTVSVPFANIEDARQQTVDVACPVATCQGASLLGSMGDALLTIGPDKRAHLIVDTGPHSGITQNPPASSPKLRSCAR